MVINYNYILLSVTHVISYCSNGILLLIILFAVHSVEILMKQLIISFLDSYMIETGIDPLHFGQYIIGMNRSYFVEYMYISNILIQNV